MKHEIETRFLEIDVAAMVARLTELGATDGGEVMLNEIVFYDKHMLHEEDGKLVCSPEINRMTKLRKKGDTVTLTHKENLKGGIDGVKEMEFEVSDMDEAKHLLEALGLEGMVQLMHTRDNDTHAPIIAILSHKSSRAVPTVLHCVSVGYSSLLNKSS